MLEHAFGGEHTHVAKALSSLGVAYIDLGDANRSVELLKRALAIQEREYGPDHGITSRTRFSYAKSLMALGARTDAVREMARCIDGLKSAFGEDHYWCSRADVLLLQWGIP